MEDYSYFEDESIHTIPVWLDKNFFERALRSYEHDHTIDVKTFNITPGLKPGENCSSIMYKVAVVYSSEKQKFDTKEIKLIMKTMPEADGMRKEFLKDTEAFENEAKMYATVLPEMERVLCMSGDNTRFGPELIYQNIHTEPQPVIVLEDIGPRGFRTFDSMQNDDLDEIYVIARKIAKFHAMSLYLHNNGTPLDVFDNHIFAEPLSDEDSFANKILKPNLQLFISKLATWEGYELYAKKMKGKINKLLESIVQIYTNPSTPFKVLCHGDFQPRNLMFKNECDFDEELIFVDYQFPVWATPAIDICYLMNLVTHAELVEKYRGDIIHVYYEEFKGILEKVEYHGKIPTMLDLQVEILKVAPLDLLQIVCFVPARFLDWSKVDINKLIEGGEEAFKKLNLKVYNMPDYRVFLKKQLQRLCAMGAMDF